MRRTLFGLTRSAGVRRSLPYRLSIGFLVTLLVMLGAPLLPSARAAVLAQGTIGGFEQDGNETLDPDFPGTIDWATVAFAPGGDGVIVTDDTADSGFVGSSKEEKPSAWDCNTGGGEPGKGDIIKAFVNPRVLDDRFYLDLAYIRRIGELEGGKGDVHVNFEFNQVQAPEPGAFVAGPCPLARQAGDLLVTYDFPGSGNPTIEAWRWVPGTGLPGGAEGTWVDLDLAANEVAGAVNTVQITDTVGNAPLGVLGIQRFGEASIDLTRVLNSQNTCVGFGSTNIRSRSSGESSTSALQDKLPSTGIDFSNCDMTVAKTGNGPINAGDPVHFAEYEITVTNLARTANNVVYTDVLPAGVTWVAGTGFPAACSIAEGRTLTCRWATFPTGPVIVRVKALTNPTQCAPLVNPPSRVTADHETITDNNETDPVTIGILCPDLELTKEADDSSVSRGDPIGFSINVWNVGEGIAYGATVTDTLPAGFEWTVGTLPEGVTCGIAAGVLTCQLGDLPGGGDLQDDPAVVIHIDAPDSVLAACGPVTNEAEAVATNGDDEVASGQDTLVLLCPGLNIVKTADDNLVEAGDPVGYTLEVTNTGPGDAIDVVVTDELPAGLDWTVGTLPEGVTCEIAAGVLTCQLGTLAALGADEDAPQVTIHLTADTDVPSGNAGIGDCASYPNVASADPTNGLPVLSQSAVVEVRCPLAIELGKTGDALAHVGDTVAYDFTATNSGYVDLTDIEFADPICAAGTIVRTDDGDGDASLEIDLDAGTAGLQRETWSYTCTRVVTVTDPDPLPNTATVRGIDVDGRSTDDTASWVVDLIHPAIEVDKTVNDDSPTVGETVTYTYVVTNTGDTTLSNLVIVDDKLLLVGEVATLAPQASATLTKSWLVLAGSPPSILNVGTATGVDILGKTVTDTDDATITITEVLGVVFVQPAATLPRTGAPVRNLTVIGLTLMLLGFGLHRSRRVDPVI